MNGLLWRVKTLRMAERQIDELADECRKEVLEVLDALREYGPDFPGTVQMRNTTNEYRIRVCGGYRLIFKVFPRRAAIQVGRIGPRPTVYRGYER